MLKYTMKNKLMSLLLIFILHNSLLAADFASWEIDTWVTPVGSKSLLELPFTNAFSLIYRRNVSAVADFEGEGLGFCYDFDYADLNLSFEAIVASEKKRSDEDVLEVKQKNYDRLQKNNLFFHEFSCLGATVLKKVANFLDLTMGVRQASYKQTNEGELETRTIVNLGLNVNINFGNLFVNSSFDTDENPDYQSLIYGWQSQQFGFNLLGITNITVGLKVFQINYFYDDKPLHDIGGGVMMSF